MILQSISQLFTVIAIIDTLKHIQYIEMRNRFGFKEYLSSFTKIERFIAALLFYAMLISSVFIAYDIHVQNSKLVHVPGGIFREATIGSIKFIDPINARTSIEKEISQLVFRGLLRYNPLTEDFESDLAKSWYLSDDGLTYTFKIKDSASFHNGSKLTIEDVVGTYNLATNKPYSDIIVNKIADDQVSFTIPERDVFFAEHFTLGILPVTILSGDDPWAALKSDSFSRKPIGSGIFKVSSLVHKDIEDIITLVPSVQSHTKKLRIHAFRDEQALRDNLEYISAVRSVPSTLRDDLKKNGWKMHDLKVPRYAVLFFDNITDGPTSAAQFRLAMKYGVNKQTLTESVPHTEVMNFPISAFDSQVISYNKERAASLMYNEGWGVFEDDPQSLRRNKDRVPLILDLVTTQDEDFLKAARELKTQFEDLGLTINIKALPLAEIQRRIIEPREFQLLLLGQDMGLNDDFRQYLHSSQISSPGLNLSQYKSTEADVLLSKIAQSAQKTEYTDYLKEFKNIINRDVPLIFLFRTFDVYATAPTAQVSFPDNIATTANRFLKFPEWMVKTKRVWR